jgi:hypothetical protein
MTFAGIRFHITTAIHARVIITAGITTIAGVGVPTVVTTIAMIGVVILDIGVV